jgi:hypothetical protein
VIIEALDVAHAEAVEKELGAFIERRADKTPDPDTSEPSYQESVRRYHERERQERLWQRLRFHERQIQNHAATFMELLERHKAGVERCEAMLGIASPGKAGRG